MHVGGVCTLQEQPTGNCLRPTKVPRGRRCVCVWTPTASRAKRAGALQTHSFKEGVLAQVHGSPHTSAVLTPQHLGTDCHRAGGSETEASPAWRSQCDQDSCSSGGCNTRLTLLTTMKPLESMLMPLCLRNPVAGTAPAGESKGLFFL